MKIIRLFTLPWRAFYHGCRRVDAFIDGLFDFDAPTARDTKERDTTRVARFM